MFTQNERPLRIATPLGPDALLLESMSGSEGISRPFRFRLELLSENPRVSAEDLLGQPAAISLDLAEAGQRYVHGRIASLSQKQATGRVVRYEAELVPWLWFLSLRSNCRVFQRQTVPQIVEEVFTRAGWRDFRSELHDRYDPREYCVQYRETDLAFVSRLLEDEGIFYFFEHQRSRHILVLADTPAVVKPCAGQPEVVYGAHSENWSEGRAMESLDRRIRVRPGRVALADYDFQKPSFNLQVAVQQGPPGEVYDYPGGYVSREQGERQARLRLEEHEAHAVIIEGETYCRGLVPGYRFELKGHYREDVNQSYTVVSVEHEARNSGWESGPEAHFEYSNRIQAVPHGTVYRPERTTPKPRIQGVQTAVVVGPTGEEIWVDKYGRVKVQFHWDREGQRDDRSSCWVRVAQSWSGRRRGLAAWPRVGQEVVLEFEEGDPDRPLVIGQMYNADQMPAWDLPANKTVTGVRSRSSPGGATDNYNEIRFDDRKGAEELGITAERDKTELVKHTTSETVGCDRLLTVKRDRLEAVQHDDHETVSGERRTQIDGNWTIKVGGERHEKVGTLYALEGGQEIHIKSGQKLVIESGEQISIVGPGGYVVLDSSGVTISGNLVRVNSSGPAPALGSAVQIRSPRLPGSQEAEKPPEKPAQAPGVPGPHLALPPKGLAAALAGRKKKRPLPIPAIHTAPAVLDTLARIAAPKLQQIKSWWQGLEGDKDRALLEGKAAIKQVWGAAKSLESTVGVQHVWVDKQGSLAKWGNHVQLGAYGFSAESGITKTKDGVSADLIKADAHFAVAQAEGSLEGKHGELEGSVKVLSAEADANVGAEFTSQAKELHAAAGASVDLVKAEASGKLRIHIPFTTHEIILGGGAEAGIGASAEGKASAGWTAEDGFQLGSELKLGFGPSLGLNFNIGFK